MKSCRQTGYQTVSAIGLLMFIVGVWLTRGLFPLHAGPLRDGMLFSWQMKALLRDTGAALTLSAIIINGLRTLRAEGISPGRSVLPAAAYLVVVMFMTLNAAAYVQTDKILASYDFGDMIAAMEALLGRNELPESKRRMLQGKLAESRYLQDGHLTAIDTKDGQKGVYRPSPEIIRFKRQNDATRRHIGWIKNRARRFVFLWAMVLVLATGAGFGRPGRRRDRNGVTPPGPDPDRCAPAAIEAHPSGKERS